MLAEFIQYFLWKLCEVEAHKHEDWANNPNHFSIITLVSFLCITEWVWSMFLLFLVSAFSSSLISFYQFFHSHGLFLLFFR